VGKPIIITVSIPGKLKPQLINHIEVALVNINICTYDLFRSPFVQVYLKNYILQYIAYLKIKGMPFNCEASQFVDIPLDSVNFDTYSFYKHGYTKTSPGRCKRKCKHVKTCKHKKGQSDCEDILPNFEYIKNQALISKDQGQSIYPKALIWQEYKDENGKKHSHSYVTLNNQEGK
jgi:hypothetical protein